MYDRILVPTDGSEGADAAVDHAIHLATEHGSELHTLYVVPTNVGPEGDSWGILDALERTGERAIEEIVDRAADAGVERARRTVVHGVPYRAILQYVDDEDIDLVVMGTHGRTGLDRYLLGSVTEKVVRLSDAPVLTVRIPDEE